MTRKIHNLQTVVKENIIFKFTFLTNNTLHYVLVFPYKVVVIDIVFFILINKILNNTINVETAKRLWEVLVWWGLWPTLKDNWVVNVNS